MRYLVTIKDSKPFLTDWFNVDNNFNIEMGMIVYDLRTFKYTTDGKNWITIPIDNL